MVSSPPPISESAGRSTRRETWAAGAAMFLFLAWLFLPLAFSWLRRASGQGQVRVKEAVQRPVLRGRPLPDFLRDFSLYYEKSSSIRPLLIPKYMAFKLYSLGIYSLSSVVVGRNHWLFMGRETTKIDELRYFLGTNPFLEEDLSRWLQMLSERQRWLEQRGIAYWLVVAPNKSTIYPEYMPAIYPRGRRTRLDQLAEFMAQRAPGFPLLDLRPVMNAGKKAHLLYWPTDTHWNYFGRYLAYREIVRRLAPRFPSLEAIPEDAFTLEPFSKASHDLEDLLLLPWDAQGPFFKLVPKRPLPSHPVPARDEAAVDHSVTFRSKKGTIRLALIIHDSFGDTLKELMSTHFRKSKWILDRSHAFPAAWIEKKRPCVVIDEITERYLDEDPWTNPEEIRR